MTIGLVSLSGEGHYFSELLDSFWRLMKTGVLGLNLRTPVIIFMA